MVTAKCGGRETIDGTADSLTSPNFPENYGPNLDCFWILQGPVGHYLTINITKMTLQCPADVLEIIDPAASTANASITIRDQETAVAVQGISVVEARANASGGVLYKDCEKVTKGKSFETEDSRAYVWFKSGDSSAASGFKVTFNASVEGTEAKLE